MSWDARQTRLHPRGKGGRFVKKGTPEWLTKVGQAIQAEEPGAYSMAQPGLRSGSGLRGRLDLGAELRQHPVFKAGNIGEGGQFSAPEANALLDRVPAARRAPISQQLRAHRQRLPEEVAAEAPATTRLAAYEKLTRRDFAALPPSRQAEILADIPGALFDGLPLDDQRRARQLYNERFAAAGNGNLPTTEHLAAYWAERGMEPPLTIGRSNTSVDKPSAPVYNGDTTTTPGDAMDATDLTFKTHSPGWGTTKTAGLNDGDTALYFGGQRGLPNGGGRRVRVVKQATNIELVDAETGKHITSGGTATRWWLAPDPSAAPKPTGKKVSLSGVPEGLQLRDNGKTDYDGAKQFDVYGPDGEHLGRLQKYETSHQIRATHGNISLGTRKERGWRFIPEGRGGLTRSGQTQSSTVRDTLERAMERRTQQQAEIANLASLSDDELEARRLRANSYSGSDLAYTAAVRAEVQRRQAARSGNQTPPIQGGRLLEASDLTDELGTKYTRASLERTRAQVGQSSVPKRVSRSEMQVGDVVMVYGKERTVERIDGNTVRLQGGGNIGVGNDERFPLVRRGTQAQVAERVGRTASGERVTVPAPGVVNPTSGGEVTSHGTLISRRHSFTGQHVVIELRDGTTVEGSLGGWGTQQIVVHPKGGGSRQTISVARLKGVYKPGKA